MFEYSFSAIIQGISEFIPISSSAHIKVISLYTQLPKDRLLEVVLHFGTLLTLLLYFFKKISLIAKAFFLKIKSPQTTPDGWQLLCQIFWGTLPTVIIGFFVHTLFKTGYMTTNLIAISSIIFGTLLLFVDQHKTPTTSLKDLSLLKCTMIGLFQSLAFIPGASRLGSTLIGSRMMGLNRKDSATFSFLLAIPTILGANTLVILTLSKEKLVGSLSPYFIGACIAFFVGLLSISFFMKWIEKRSYLVFALYRILFGLFLLIAF